MKLKPYMVRGEEEEDTERMILRLGRDNIFPEDYSLLECDAM
jgi:hypothetical protein